MSKRSIICAGVATSTSAKLAPSWRVLSKTVAAFTKDDVVAFALYEKACRLNWKPGCTSAQNYLVRAPKIREYAYLIDPSSTTQFQLIRAQEVVKTADKMPGVNTVIRLMQEGDEDASWLLGGWLYYGLEGVFDTSRKADGIILIENAARVGHVEAAIWLGMAYWYGDGVPEDRKKARTICGSPPHAAAKKARRFIAR